MSRWTYRNSPIRTAEQLFAKVVAGHWLPADLISPAGDQSRPAKTISFTTMWRKAHRGAGCGWMCTEMYMHLYSLQLRDSRVAFEASDVGQARIRPVMIFIACCGRAECAVEGRYLKLLEVQRSVRAWVVWMLGAFAGILEQEAAFNVWRGGDWHFWQPSSHIVCIVRVTGVLHEWG
eukprot:TRINITY_DN7918_c0_g1_i4.p1 TRINITY_DN7918_c0_g1~~TRINITY_DN7918_c0_g1_i4.p1  ORF type:complete len:177 (+),score=17.39 TRINITY_DN7918_c0_g1_i4:224-754(+)